MRDERWQSVYFDQGVQARSSPTRGRGRHRMRLFRRIWKMIFEKQVGCRGVVRKALRRFATNISTDEEISTKTVVTGFRSRSNLLELICERNAECWTHQISFTPRRPMGSPCAVA